MSSPRLEPHHRPKKKSSMVKRLWARLFSSIFLDHFIRENGWPAAPYFIMNIRSRSTIWGVSKHRGPWRLTFPPLTLPNWPPPLGLSWLTLRLAWPGSTAYPLGGGVTGNVLLGSRVQLGASER
jgi:hypothetical protein